MASVFRIEILVSSIRHKNQLKLGPFAGTNNLEEIYGDTAVGHINRIRRNMTNLVEPEDDELHFSYLDVFGFNNLVDFVEWSNVEINGILSDAGYNLVEYEVDEQYCKRGKSNFQVAFNYSKGKVVEIYGLTSKELKEKYLQEWEK